ATALAAAAHLEVDAIVLHVDQLDEAAVTGNCGIDHRVDQLLNFRLEFSAHAAPLIWILYPRSGSGATGPRWALLSRTTARCTVAPASAPRLPLRPIGA